MSSDSDDDFSYTNSTSLLKKYTKNSNFDDGNTSVDLNSSVPNGDVFDFGSNQSGDTKETNKYQVEDDDNSLDEDNFPIKNVNTRLRKKNLNAERNEDSPIDLCSTNDSPKIHVDRSVIVINDEIDSPVNIISMIDSCLNKTKSNRGRGRGRGKNKIIRRANETRTSKRKRNDLVPEIIYEIDSDYPITNSVTRLSDDVNYNQTIKVWWKSQYLKKFNVRRFEKLTCIFECFSERENISEDRLLFTINDKVVSKTDTAESLDLNAASIIEGGTLTEKSHLASGVQTGESISLKVQMRDLKHPLMINMKITDDMNILMSKCAEELKLPISDLKFYFDGDVIKANDSPFALQLEGGECIDCVRLSTLIKPIARLRNGRL